ncbi:MAG: proton-conducting transporter membrane subunit, partial [Candidatus Krumholzibacteria bacterium]
TRLIDEFGGLARVMPVYAVIFMIVTLSSIGLPLTNGFIGEFLILLGTFRENVFYAVLAGSGVVLGAIYMLWMLQRVFFGPIKHAANEALRDLSLREIVVFVPLVVLIIFMGVYPKPFLSRMEPSVNKFIAEVRQSRADIQSSQAGFDPQAVVLGEESEDESIDEDGGGR